MEMNLIHTLPTFLEKVKKFIDKRESMGYNECEIKFALPVGI